MSNWSKLFQGLWEPPRDPFQDLSEASVRLFETANTLRRLAVRLDRAAEDHEKAAERLVDVLAKQKVDGDAEKVVREDEKK